jgi:hypothetical protein
VIRFRCEHCGRKFRVPDSVAGKKAVCLKCKNIVIVPEIEGAKSVANQPETGTSEIDSKDSILDPNLFDIPQKTGAVDTQRDVPDKALENLRKLQSYETEREPPPERKLPWLIDIFLYAASRPGLTILGIIIVVPLLFKFIVQLLGAVTLVFPPMLVFFSFFVAIDFIVNILLALYMYWYLCECVRDSAAGGLRAPETIGTTPGLGEMLWQMIRILICFAFFAGPSLVYFFHIRKTDTIFWILLVYGASFFPMGLLAVVMFDSFSALNPLLLIKSIFNSFFQYCGLVLLFCGLGVVAVVIALILQRFRISWVLAYLLSILFVYLLMVSAHLLGRFYWKYQERLNWDV